MAKAEPDPETIRCTSCGYSWEYSGSLWHATCPRCQSKTMTHLHDDYES